MYIKDKTIVCVIFCILSVLLIVSLFKYQTDGARRYQEMIVDLFLLEKHNSKIEEQVFLSQLGLLRNYDQIIRTSNEMEGVFQRLMEKDFEINAQDNHEIDKRKGVLGTEISRLSVAVGRFLTANAARNNSLIYIARQMRYFLEKSTANNSSKKIYWVNLIMQEALLYSRWPELERKDEIERLISQLQISRLPPSAELISEDIKLIVDHVRVLAHNSDMANYELDIILSSHITETITLLRKTVINKHQQYIDLERKKSTAVWVLCILLILLQIVMIRPKAPKLAMYI